MTMYTSSSSSPTGLPANERWAVVSVTRTTPRWSAGAGHLDAREQPRGEPRRPRLRAYDYVTMTIENAMTIKVSSAAYIGYVAEDLEKRLKDNLNAQVQPKKDRIIVLAILDSEDQIAAARKTVEQAILGVNQLLALDPLEQGRVLVRLL
jgi:hypothetical protein